MGAPMGNRNAAGPHTGRTKNAKKSRRKMPYSMIQQRKRERSQAAFRKRFYSKKVKYHS